MSTNFYSFLNLFHSKINVIQVMADHKRFNFPVFQKIGCILEVQHSAIIASNYFLFGTYQIKYAKSRFLAI